jgi:hypothetical protein
MLAEQLLQGLRFGAGRAAKRSPSMSTTGGKVALDEKPSKSHLYWAYFWAGGEELPASRLLSCGAVIWLFYALGYLWIRGVVLDQDVVPAQIISGAIRYPVGHPHQLFYPIIYNLPNYAGALLWSLASGPWLLSFVRNLLSLFLSAYIAFSAATILTNVPMWGHVAALFTLSETLIQFGGRYPINIFPMFYSDGQIGFGIALLIAVLMAAGSWGIGGFFFGLLPAIHGAMTVVVYPWGACIALLRRRELLQSKRRFVVGAGLGIVICAILALYLFGHRTPFTDLPYRNATNGGLVQSAFNSTADYHRALPNARSLAYLISPLVFTLFSGLLLWSDRGETLQVARITLLSLGFASWPYVFGAWASQLLGVRLPEVVSMSMPNRFSNIAAFLLLPLTVAVMSRAREAMDRSGRTACDLLLAGLLLAEAVSMQGPRYRLAHGLIFAAWGLALGMSVCAFWSDTKRCVTIIAGSIVVGVTLSLVTSPYKMIITTVFAAALIGSVILLQVLRRLAPSMNFATAALFGAAVLTTALSIPGPKLVDEQSWGKISSYEKGLGWWLASHSSPDEMVLPPVVPRTELQAKVNRPVLMELETLYLMTYMPSLAAPIGMMAKDLYGIDFTDPDQLVEVFSSRNLSQKTLDRIWIERTQEEWRSIGRKYKFRFVLSRNPLHLSAVFPGPTWTLYCIP